MSIRCVGDGRIPNKCLAPDIKLTKLDSLQRVSWVGWAGWLGAFLGLRGSDKQRTTQVQITDRISTIITTQRS